jgi:hypothetical protein
MRKVTGSLLAAVALVALPHMALAQRRAASGGGGGAAKNEIGVDLGAAYSHYGSGCTTSCGAFEAGTPVDIRWGFMSSGPLSFEPRFTLSYFTGLGGHDLSFTPDLNVLYRLSNATARKGAYLTGGLGLDWTNVGSAGTSTSATQLSLNAGVGKRIPMESNAWRLEGFFRYNFANTSKGLPSRFDIGARVGMSFWR